MSQSPLATELHQLRLELAHLSARVPALEEEAATSRVAGASLQSSPVTVNYLGATSLPEVPPFPEHLQQSPGVSSAGQSSAAQRVIEEGAGGVPSDAERRRIAEEAGAFIRRSLDGDHRGTSGRTRLHLPNNCYILARDIHGTTYNPVRVFYNFSVLRPLVKQQGNCRDSVSIGFPTVWEAKVCTAAAQLSWPDG